MPRSDAAVGALRDGAVIAVKGVGGYHLAADACSAAAVGELRRRKHRDDKPFAVMVPDLVARPPAVRARSDVAVDPAHVATAADRAGSTPAVVDGRRRGGTGLAGARGDAAVQPAPPPAARRRGASARDDQRQPQRRADRPRGRRRRCPTRPVDRRVARRTIARSTSAATTPWRGRCPDGCSCCAARAAMRPSRSPCRSTRRPSPSSPSAPSSKNTVAVTKGRHVVASHHIGDLEHARDVRARSCRRSITCRALYGVVPDVVAHDLHPEYLSTKFAVELDLPADRCPAPSRPRRLVHGRARPHPTRCSPCASTASATGRMGRCGAESSSSPTSPASAASVICGRSSMPGGVAAIREPWRMAASWLAAACGAEAAVERLTAVDRRAAAVVELAEHGHGPIDDGHRAALRRVAVLLGGRPTVTFEAQAAIELEAARQDGPAERGAPALRRTRRVRRRRRRRRPRPQPVARRPRRRRRCRRPGSRAGRRLPRGARRRRRRCCSVARRRRRRRRRRADRRRVPERATHRGRGIDAASTQGATSSSTPRSRSTTAASASARPPSRPGGASTVPMVSQREATYCRVMSTGLAPTDGG